MNTQPENPTCPVDAPSEQPSSEKSCNTPLMDLFVELLSEMRALTQALHAQNRLLLSLVDQNAAMLETMINDHEEGEEETPSHYLDGTPMKERSGDKAPGTL